MPARPANKVLPGRKVREVWQVPRALKARACRGSMVNRDLRVRWESKARSERPALPGNWKWVRLEWLAPRVRPARRVSPETRALKAPASWVRLARLARQDLPARKV